MPQHAEQMHEVARVFCGAAGELFLDYTFSTAKNAGFNTFRFFALVHFVCCCLSLTIF